MEPVPSDSPAQILADQPKQARQVLLVDDLPANLGVLYEALEREAYELLIAQSGEEALEIAAAAQPALILLDINMPGMDGFETCRRLKADPATKEAVIIFLSARDSVQDKVTGLSLGAVDYISKPFQFEEVVARVNTQLALKEAQEELERLNHRTDALLRNILPGSVAERLKNEERDIVDHFSEATVLFCDLVGFTPLAKRLGPVGLVGLLNRIFRAMDELAEQHGLEKIKTIGDAYMVCGGVPDPMPDHAQAVAAFALDVIETVPSLCENASLDLRIGMHSGPVVAGVIGERKFAYDLWGDTVNTASRLESGGVPGRIQLSRETADRLGNTWLIEERGEIELKGRGTMETCFLIGRHSIP